MKEESKKYMEIRHYWGQLLHISVNVHDSIHYTDDSEAKCDGGYVLRKMFDIVSIGDKG